VQKYNYLVIVQQLKLKIIEKISIMLVVGISGLG